MKLTSNMIVSEVLRWFRTHRRDLPWRNTMDPYKILVSEMMLQQTQVSRVEAKYPEFLKRFPKFGTLAKTSKSEVIRAWSGMGYNSRAIRLREVARIVVEQHGGELPTSAETLQQLPGIGRCTAQAVSCFAHGKAVPIVDTNVCRVLTRLFWRTSRSTDRQNPEKIWNLTERLVPKNRAIDWNLALMDLGATICRGSAPRCQECPVQRLCRSAFRIKRVKTRVSRREPFYQGRPRRYYRGRVVEALRNLNHDGWISARRLGPRVKPDFRPRELPWLHKVLWHLERDGLIVIRRNKNGISRYVSLA